MGGEWIHPNPIQSTTTSSKCFYPENTLRTINTATLSKASGERTLRLPDHRSYMRLPEIRSGLTIKGSGGQSRITNYNSFRRCLGRVAGVFAEDLFALARGRTKSSYHRSLWNLRWLKALGRNFLPCYHILQGLWRIFSSVPRSYEVYWDHSMPTATAASEPGGDWFSKLSRMRVCATDFVRRKSFCNESP